MLQDFDDNCKVVDGEKWNEFPNKSDIFILIL